MKILRAELLATAAGPGDFPRGDLSEVAFVGRSNVGKSSLLNRLVNRKSLARTSGTPGKTRLLHFYRVDRTNGSVCFVDLPGYGFAKVSRAERERWRKLIDSYLDGRDPLRAVVLLLDLRRDWSEEEQLLVEWLEERGVAVIVALTKCDKLKPMRRAKRVSEIAKSVDFPRERVVPTSAEKGFGIPELWRAIDGLLGGR